jgi:hypothetical protein
MKSLLTFIFNSTYIIGVIALLIVGVIAFSALQFSRSFSDVYQQNYFRVSGESKRFVKPDRVTVTFSSTIEGKDVRDIQRRSSEAVDKATTAILALGVEDKELTTSNYNITPTYNYTSGKSVIDGYSSTISLNVKTKLITKVADIIDAATKSGINNVSALSFYLEDSEKVKQELKLEAIDNAKTKASELASKSGLRLGTLKNVEEGGYYPMYSNASGASPMALSEKSVSRDSTIPLNVQPGESEMNMNITLVYETY